MTATIPRHWRTFRDAGVPGFKILTCGTGSYSVTDPDDVEIAWEITSVADVEIDRARCTYPAQARQVAHIFAYLRTWDGVEYDCPSLITWDEFSRYRADCRCNCAGCHFGTRHCYSVLCGGG